MAVERHADFPRAREHLRILDGGFIQNDIGTARRVALHYMQGVAMEISGSVEPGLIVQTSHVDHQCVALPVSNRPTHPAIDRGGTRFPHVDGANGARVLIRYQDGFRRLNYLEWIR